MTKGRGLLAKLHGHFGGEERVSRVGKESLKIVSGQVGALIGSIAGIRIITEVAPRAVYGEAALVVGFVTLLCGLTTTPFSHYAGRAYADVSRTGQHGSFRSFALDRLLGICVLVSVLIVMGGCLYDLLKGGFRPVLWILAGVVLIGTSFTAFENTILTVSRRQGARSIWQSAECLGWPLCVAGAMLLFGASSSSYLAGRALFPIMGLLVFWTFTSATFPYSGPRPSGPQPKLWSREAWRYALPLVPMAFVAWIVMLSDRYLLAHYRSLSEVGLYAAIVSLSRQPFVMVGEFVSRLFQPVIYAASARGNRQRQRSLLRYYALTIVLLCSVGFGLFVVTSRWIIDLLLAAEYREGASNLFPWVAASGAFLTIAGVFECEFLADKRTWRLTVSYLIAAVANLVLNLLLIPRMGARGAAISMCVSFAVYLTSCGFTAQMKPPAKFDLKEEEQPWKID